MQRPPAFRQESADAEGAKGVRYKGRTQGRPDAIHRGALFIL